jgi:hypothetical protein
MKPEGVSVNPGGRKAAAHCWCHLECARSQTPDGQLSTPVCPHWLKKGVCSFGALCFYEHPEGLVAEVKAKAEQPRRIGTWKRRVTRKSGKSSIFRRWLIDEFGLELLSSGSGILDVAGGKGEVAFELVNLNRIPTTVVDPRILDLSSYKRKFEFGICAFTSCAVIDAFELAARRRKRPLSHTKTRAERCCSHPLSHTKTRAERCCSHFRPL